MVPGGGIRLGGNVGSCSGSTVMPLLSEIDLETLGSTSISRRSGHDGGFGGGMVGGTDVAVTVGAGAVVLGAGGDVSVALGAAVLEGAGAVSVALGVGTSSMVRRDSPPHASATAPHSASAPARVTCPEPPKRPRSLARMRVQA